MGTNKITAVLVIFSLLFVAWNDYAVAAAQTANDVKTQINKHAGKSVNVELKDHSKIKGSIVAIRDDSFDLRLKSGDVRSVQYSEVEKVKGGLSKGAKIALIVGVAVTAFVVIGVIALKHETFDIPLPIE
jgi:hypothetical protein